MNLKFLFEDKLFYSKVIKIALPIAAQNLILASLNMVDTVIIGGLGEQAIASVGLSNQYFFLLNLFLFGIASGSAIFTAQYWGNKDIQNIKRVLGICLITALSCSSIFTLGGLLFPRQIIGFFTTDPEVIAMGGQYLSIIVLGYVVTSITFSYNFVLRSTGNVRTPMIISIIALGVNTLLNYMLVYGLFGAPQLGVPGSAIATVIARFIEVSLVLSVVYGRKYQIAAKLREMTDLSAEFIKKFYKVTIPVILNESVWALGVTMYSVVYARMGTEVVAATNISGTIERLMFVVFLGFGNACAIMIGNKIGEGNKDEAFLYAKRFSILLPAGAVLVGVFVAFNAHWMLSAYNVSPVVYDYAYKVLMVFAFVLWLRIFNYVCIVGILRSGGDTKFCLIIDIGSVWLVGVPLAFLGGLVWHLPIHWVYALIGLEEAFKMVLGIPRILSKKWINDLTEKTA